MTTIHKDALPEPPRFHVVDADSSQMKFIRSGEVDLIVTGPPYFSAETEKELKKAVKEQERIEQVREEITEYALSLHSVFAEMVRVLKPGGVLAIQTKDIRYGRILIRLAGIHRDMAESEGVDLINRVYWSKIRLDRVAATFRKSPMVGKFHAEEVEDLLIFSKGMPDVTPRTPVELGDEEIAACTNPFWTLPPVGKARKHPHQAPKALIRRLIALYSRPGELVLDPFLGHGTTVEVAVEMGRRAIGYEKNPAYAKEAREYLDARFYDGQAETEEEDFIEGGRA